MDADVKGDIHEGLLAKSAQGGPLGEGLRTGLGDRARDRPALHHEPLPARDRPGRVPDPVGGGQLGQRSRAKRFSMVLTNPPFGKKSSVRIVNEEGELESELS